MSRNIQFDQKRFKFLAHQPMFNCFTVGQMEEAQKLQYFKALELCYKLIQEEVQSELLQDLISYRLSPSDANLIKVYDGCIDSIYVILDLMNVMGLDFQEGWEEVHRANMAKMPGGVATLNSVGKVVKPAGWKEPDIAGLIAKAQARLDDPDACVNQN